MAVEEIKVIKVWHDCFACQGGFLLCRLVWRLGSHLLSCIYTFLVDPAFPVLIWWAIRAFLGLPVSLASPWLPSLPVSSLQLHWALVIHPRQPELRDRWASGPLTVITDPFPSHHLAPDLHSLSSEEEALFLQSQARELVMIPVQRGHSPWTRSSSDSRGCFCSRCCSGISLLIQPLLEDHKQQEQRSLQKSLPAPGTDNTSLTGQVMGGARSICLRASSI